MKKTLLLAAASLFIAKASMAQDVKNVRFGIRATPSVNWMTPENDKKVQKNGSVMKAGIGLVLEFKLSDVASIQTGLDYTMAGFKAKYQGSDSAYYLYKDDEIVEAKIKGDSLNSPYPATTKEGYASHRLLDRRYSIGYLNIPLTVKLKTKDIGGLTYFGQIGGNLFIRTSARGTDNVEKWTLQGTTMVKSTEEIEKIDISKGINLISACGSIGGGVEYNISGSTSLYGSIHYQHHFMNATKADSGYLIRSKTENNTTKLSEFQNAAKLRQFVLAIGVLF